MFKSEKALTVPGEYPVVFECSVLAFQDARVRVKSASPATGMISGRTGIPGFSRPFRLDVTIQGVPGQCIVTARCELAAVVATDFGSSARIVARFFDGLLRRSAPLMGNPQAFAMVTGGGAPPSASYSSAPMRPLFGQTGAGLALNWTVFAVAMFIILCAVLGVILIANGPH